MSDTPRVNAAIQWMKDKGRWQEHFPEIVAADHARQLERELNEARALYGSALDDGLRKSKVANEAIERAEAAEAQLAALKASLGPVREKLETLRDCNYGSGDARRIAADALRLLEETTDKA